MQEQIRGSGQSVCSEAGRPGRGRWGAAYPPAELAVSERLHADPVHLQQPGPRGHPCPLGGSSGTQHQPESALMFWRFPPPHTHKRV